MVPAISVVQIVSMLKVIAEEFLLDMVADLDPATLPTGEAGPS